MPVQTSECSPLRNYWLFLFLTHKVYIITKWSSNHLFLFPSLKSIWVTTYMFTICFAANVGLLYGVVCTIAIVIFRFPRWDVIYWNVLVAHNYVFFLEHCFAVGIYLHYTKFNSEISVFSCTECWDGWSWKGHLEAIWSNSCPGRYVLPPSSTYLFHSLDESSTKSSG